MPTMLDSLNRGLHRALSTDERVIVLGEDILDPYGGAFKVTRGLSTVFPDRVWTTPISEAGMVGVATGMALRGLKPVVEIMFGDFLTLAADQLINHATKFRWMYNDQVRVPLVVRTPMGGRRGYGPTHSQTLEKHFLGVPSLRVVVPSTLGDPGELLSKIILTGEDPTLFIENKLQYLLPLQKEMSLSEYNLHILDDANTYCLMIREAPAPVLSLAAYGYMAELAQQAILRLAYEHEIFCELVVFTQLSPFRLESLFASTQQTGRLLVVEEGSFTLGWGAEVLAQVSERMAGRLKITRRLAARDLPVPAASTLENAVLPGVDEIIRAATEMMV